jgi:hypothetical protein
MEFVPGSCYRLSDPPSTRYSVLILYYVRRQNLSGRDLSRAGTSASLFSSARPISAVDA